MKLGKAWLQLHGSPKDDNRLISSTQVAQSDRQVGLRDGFSENKVPWSRQALECDREFRGGICISFVPRL
jgi:hypothetical protein